MDGSVMFLSEMLKKGLQQLQERRRSERIPALPLAAYFWDGAVPLPHVVRDISRTGVYLFTQERWYPGTMLQLTIDAKGRAATTDQAVAPEDSMVVWSKVVRYGADGVGFEFMILKARDRKKMADLIEHAKTISEKSDA
jgi:hypothetical protein